MTEEEAALLKFALYVLVKISTSFHNSEKYPKCQPPEKSQHIPMAHISRLASNPSKRLFQLPCRELNHRRATVGASAWGLARFQLVDQFLHFQVAEELTGFDGSPFADHLDHARF
jgi:hypothetical protein